MCIEKLIFWQNKLFFTQTDFRTADAVQHIWVKLGTIGIYGIWFSFVVYISILWFWRNRYKKKIKCCQQKMEKSHQNVKENSKMTKNAFFLDI